MTAVVRLVLVVLLVLATGVACAGGIGVPRAALAYRSTLTAAAHSQFGIDAPIATLAAQLHQESGWKANARSPVGAQGLAQFMPSTANDLARRRPDLCSPSNPFDARWAIRCQSAYMGEQVDAIRVIATYPPMSECTRWAMALSAYNGGMGWVTRDRRIAIARGMDPNRWFDQVELTADPRRAPRFVRENRGYPKRILLLITPVYVDDSWGRGVDCSQEHT